MSSIIKFTPILGGICREDDEQDKVKGPMAYILEIDESVVLLDCGWDDQFEVETIAPLVAWVPRITAVLLSHADVYHLGALPYLVGRCGLKAPIYATIPVVKMGEMFMYDLYQSRKELEDFTRWSLDDVDSAFGAAEQLRYGQRVQIPGTFGVEVSAYPSGHMVGGSVWKIQKETEEIVYAVDVNHKKERHLNGTVLENLKRPTILITDARNACTAQAPLRDRNQALLDAIAQTVQSGGNVLLPVDTAGRVLELLLCLEQQWSPQRASVPVVFLTHVSATTSEFARSQIEWMSDAVTKMYDFQRANPFAFKHIDVRQSLKDLEALPSPKIVLASSPTLNCGMAQALFLQWASNPKNAVLFCERDFHGSLAHDLMAGEVPRMLKMVLKKRTPLVGEELAAYLEDKRRREQEERDNFAQGANTEFVAMDTTSLDEMMDAMWMEDQHSHLFPSRSSELRRRRTRRRKSIPRSNQEPNGANKYEGEAAGEGIDRGDNDVEEEEEEEQEEEENEEEEGIEGLRSGVRMGVGMRDGGGRMGDGLPSLQSRMMARIQANFAGGHDWIVDRYARQNLARSSLFQNAPMFPYKFKRRRFDVWGEVLDLDAMRAPPPQTSLLELLTAAPVVSSAEDGGAGAAGADGVASGSELPEKEKDKEADGGSGVASAADDAIPFKFLVEDIVVGVYCTVRYIDFEGRSDGRSLKQILNHIAPRKVVLVHGDRAGAQHLREHCEVSLANVCQSVSTPAVGETVDITIDTNIVKVRMKESLNSMLKFVHVGAYEVGFFAGALRQPTAGAVGDADGGALAMLPVGERAKKDPAGSGDSLLQVEPLLEPVAHPVIFIGDLKLAEFRDELHRAGFRTDLMGGVLVCNDVVSISKETLGNHARIFVRGAISEEYYRVKDLLLSKFTIL